MDHKRYTGGRSTLIRRSPRTNLRSCGHVEQSCDFDRFQRRSTNSIQPFHALLQNQHSMIGMPVRHLKAFPDVPFEAALLDIAVEGSHSTLPVVLASPPAYQSFGFAQLLRNFGITAPVL